MVNAVMDAIALLSSLATDLDLMLNDLRSSPTSRFIHQPTSSGIRSNQSVSIVSSQQQQQRRYNQDHNYHLNQSTIHQPQHIVHHHQQRQQHQQFFQLRSHVQQHQNITTSALPKDNTATTALANTSQTSFLGDTTSTSQQKLLWSSETTSTTHQQLKSRRLPFCVDSNGSGVDGCTDVKTNALSSGGGVGSGGSSISNGNVGGVGTGCIGDSYNSIDAENDCCGDGLIEDDLQALLPNCRQMSRDELSQSRASLVSSSDGGVLAESETSSESSEGSTSPPCDLGLVERLLRTHPVWFLPGIQRAGAVHLLQGKEEGNFVVRGSSQPNTMAVSVRLPPDTGPYIEHYLIQSNDGILSLESSRFKFDSIPALIAHYAQCCDELPVQLTLPRALREAKNRQQLSSLALLGQEFWRYPMANPKTNSIEIKSPNSLTDTSGIGTTAFSSTTTTATIQQQHQHQPHFQQHQQQQMKLFSPTTPLGSGGVFSQAGTPSDTASSLSSFTTSTGHNQQLMSPESIDSVILTMSPVELSSNRVPLNSNLNGNVNIGGMGSNSTIGKLSTFKSSSSSSTTSSVTNQVQIRSTNEKLGNVEQVVRATRPTPPNTLNLGPLRTPPAPPVRWSKPLTPISPAASPITTTTTDPSHISANNFTVTTTVTFSMDSKNQSPQQFVEVTSPTQIPPSTTMPVSSNGGTSGTPATTTTFQTFSKRLSPEGECKTTVDTLSSQGSSNRWQSQSSKDSNPNQRKMTSSNSVEVPSSGRQRRNKARKESKHYQESDILESPQVYCRSALGDKISDYEDLWTQNITLNTPLNRGPQMSSFRPDGTQGKRPDLLPETPTITSLSCNILSPTNSMTSSSNSSPPTNQKLPNSTEFSTNNNDKQFINNINSQPLDVISPRTTDVNKNFLPSVENSHQLVNGNQQQNQQRNRLGLVLPLNGEDLIKSENETPTTPTTVTSRSKQGSPFYAEPADALRAAAAGSNVSILRRSRGVLLPANHRHSEPPKSGIARTPICPVLVPVEIEKIAGSLDELKKKQQKRLRGRLDPWPLDSSWEFMGNNENGGDEYGDYDSEEQWNTEMRSKTNIPSHVISNENNRIKPLTVHQIIAKRLPDLNLPELVRCSTPQQVTILQNGEQMNDINNSNSGNGGNGGQRISSYDNVERNGGNLSYTTSFLNGLDGTQSDDGTVFSEPWDSSQWDSFLPHDDTSDTIHLSKCRPTLCNSEDDTIMEESSSTLKDNQGTLKANKSENHHQSHQQKVATILRSRSIRDREILCHPRNKTQCGGPGDSVRSYTLQLANDNTSTFSRNVENFISCTKESREAAPQVVMRNMRQFMNGMKNYLVKHGEGDFQQEVLKARSRLKSDEFLNLDAILETVMHQLVVLPLREHLYGMFVDYYTRSGDIQLLVENVKYACARSPVDFGIRPSVTPPTSMALNQISSLLLKLQEAELPLDKLDLFLCVIAAIFDATGCPRGQQLGADDFLPILVFVVSKCGFVGAEIEAEFMWGLLQPPLLSGEAGYYLTALCSAVHVLKSFMASDNDGTGSLDWRSSSLPACSSVLRVIIPDECNGSLQTRTLPVRPHTTTREVCRIIAHKARITNPQDYGLFKLVDGEETILTDSECPQDARIAARGKHCMLAYKRIDAKIAWPTVSPSFA